MIKKIYTKIKFLFNSFFLSAEEFAKKQGVKIGNDCSIRTREFGSEPYLITIGRNVEIAARVRFYNHGAAWLLRDLDKDFDFFGRIVIGDNIYIGENSIILAGVTIGDNVLVGAGTVVSKSIPSGSIVVGNPGRIVGNVSDFKEKYKKFNTGTKNLNRKKKREFLENMPDGKFIKK